jgi:membrane fusion protein, heavy metal efflux system
MTTDPRPALAVLLLLSLLIAGGCRQSQDETAAHEEASWSVTAWGTRFEVFPEVGALVAGQTAVAHTHVTRLEDFSPLAEGEVDIVLIGPSGEQVFGATEPVRPGIYSIELTPPAVGEFDLAFRIRTATGNEEIRGGRVRVGDAANPGGVVRAPAPRGATGGATPIDFLKEQQWRSDFGTDWVRSGHLALSAAGLARVRPPAGGETAITAPVDGVLHPPGSGSWPYPGYAITRGQAIFNLVPSVSPDLSLPSLEATVSGLETELAAARARLGRLEELYALNAVSQREVEEARARLQTLEGQRSAARQDLASARSSRGGSAAGGLAIRAPFAGQIARVEGSPGTRVSAGTELARLVRTDALWLEIALSPSAARGIPEGGIEGVVLVDRERAPVRITDGIRVVSVAPEISPRTNTVTVLIEMPPVPGLALGSSVEAHILTSQEREGIVVPATAVIDDGGVPVVYLQLAGESFVRQEISLLERQGDLVLVDHLIPGQRLVTRGGDAIRRESLMSRGEVQGHVH